MMVNPAPIDIAKHQAVLRIGFNSYEVMVIHDASIQVLRGAQQAFLIEFIYDFLEIQAESRHRIQELFS
jgi:hypothetical protein